jgi:hypothetical protein
MHKLIVAASAAALMAASTLSALAAEATGTVQSIDPAAGTVTLADGQTFTLPVEFDTASVQVGQEVTITYEEADGQMNASEILPAQQ